MATEPSPYARATEDPLFVQRFAAAYRGPHDPLDALWWLSHPADDGPSGARAPDAELRHMKAALYLKGADAAAPERYRLAADAVRRDRSAARVAADHASDPSLVWLPGADHPLAATEVAPPPVARRWLAAVAAAVVVVAVVVGGVAIVRPTLDALGSMVGSPSRSTPPGASPSATARASRPSTASAHPTPISSAPPDAVIASEGQVTGVGTLRGPITGDVRIEPIDSARFVIHLRHLHVGRSGARDIELGTSVDATYCTEEGVATAEGQITTAASQDITALYPGGNLYQDLSPMRALALRDTHLPGDRACDPATFSTAVLHWTVPAALTHLAVRNGPPADGARGAVTLRHGVPTTYTVAADDRLDDIGARFGLTIDELLWLTPFRSRGEDGQAYIGEEFNLDPASRM